MKCYFPYLLLALPFLLLKLSNAGIFLSDTNIYFYTAYELLQGKILYKDIFFTNFPLVPYISVLYFLLSFGNLPLFFLTSSFEAVGIGFLLYYLTYKQTRNTLLALMTSAIYLYSFLVLATSNHQTGVFTASLFAVLSYLFYTKRKILLTGVFIALAILTKAYFLPIFLSLLAVIAVKEREKLPLFLLSFLATCFITLLPSLVLAPMDLYRDVITYSLARSAGIEKINILRFFVTHEVLFTLLLIANILLLRKRLFLGLVSVFGIMFIFLYQDIYYLYLNFLIPFLALSFAFFYEDIIRKIHLQKYVIPTIVAILLLINLSTYITSYHTMSKIQNPQKLINTILQTKPNTLYGINSLTPALSYLTNVPLLNGIVDTNENIFRKGFLDSTKLTNDAVEQEAMIITNAASYPQFGVEDLIMGGIFKEEIVTSKCKLLLSLPVKSEGVDNRINLFSCKQTTQ